MPSLVFAGFTLLMAAVIVFGVWRSGADAVRWTVGTAIGLAVWLAFTFLLAQSGALSNFDSKPPGVLRLIFPTVVGTILLARSGFGLRVTQLPIWMLVGVQAFRIPVELLLFWFYRDGLIPKQMTFEGLNFDILSGLLALAVAWRIRRAPSLGLVRAWNVVGLLLLVNIVVIANLSAPTSYRVFQEGPSSSLITVAPFVWLPTLLVPLALFGHLVVFRWLATQRDLGRGVPVEAGRAPARG